MASLPSSFLENREWQQPPEPLWSMSLSELTHYAAVAKQSWAEYLAHVATQQSQQSQSSFNSVDDTSFPGPLLPGESWLSDSLQIQDVADGNQGVFTTCHVSWGTVIVRAKGVTADGGNSSSSSCTGLDFYSKLVAVLSNGDNFATTMVRRIQSLCPSSNEECSSVVAADPSMGEAEFQTTLFAILDQTGARSTKGERVEKLGGPRTELLYLLLFFSAFSIFYP